MFFFWLGAVHRDGRSCKRNSYCIRVLERNTLLSRSETVIIWKGDSRSFVLPDLKGRQPILMVPKCCTNVFSAASHVWVKWDTWPKLVTMISEVGGFWWIVKREDLFLILQNGYAKYNKRGISGAVSGWPIDGSDQSTFICFLCDSFGWKLRKSQCQQNFSLHIPNNEKTLLRNLHWTLSGTFTFQEALEPSEPSPWPPLEP